MANTVLLDFIASGCSVPWLVAMLVLLVLITNSLTLLY